MAFITRFRYATSIVSGIAYGLVVEVVGAGTVDRVCSVGVGAGATSGEAKNADQQKKYRPLEFHLPMVGHQTEARQSTRPEELLAQGRDMRAFALTALWRIA